MAYASDMSATEHCASAWVEAAKTSNPPDPRVGVDARTVKSAAVMKPEALETLAAAKLVKDRGRAVG